MYWEILGGTRDHWAISQITYTTNTVVQDVVDGGQVMSTTPLLTGTLSRALAAGEKLVIFKDGVALSDAPTIFGLNWSYRANLSTGSTSTFVAKVQAIDGTFVDASASAPRTITQSASGVTPLVLDLDGDGIETTTLAAGVAFDHLADGHAEQTAWVTGGDGLLVKDINLDGFINNGRELFGSGTLLPNGQNAADGFQALVGLDTNADGVINGLDADFASLKVWIDANNNGATDAGELQTLQALGIAELSLHAGTSELKDNGNLLGLVSNYTTTTGQTQALVDVWLATSGAAMDSGSDPLIAMANLANGTTEQLKLSLTDLLQLPESNGTRTLQIVGDSTDVIDLTQLFQSGSDPLIAMNGTWSTTGTVTQNGHTFNVYQHSGDQSLQVLIDQHIVQSNVHLS